METEKNRDMQLAGEGFMMSLTDGIQKMRRKGYVEDFQMQKNCLKLKDICLEPNDFVVDETLRFDESSDAADQSILYAISSAKHGVKGLLVDGFGIYHDELTNEMIQSLRAH